MSSDDRPTIDQTIRKWKSEVGVIRTSDRGTSYVIVPATNLLENLKILAKTLLDYGYTFQEIDQPRVSVKIADICWREDKIVKMSATEIRKAKVSLAADWEEALAAFSDIKISTYKDSTPKELPKEKSGKKEKPLEINPQDRIVMDTSDMVKNELNLDFLTKLGLDPSFVENSDE